GVADLLGQRKTVVRGVPGGAEPQADYWVLIDADNDSGTGGTPPGYPAGVPMTTFTGVELITRVSAGLRTQILAPTVWTWDGSVFVESMDAGIAAFFERGMFEPGVLPGQDSPEVSATFDNVSIELPGSLGAALTDPFRLQAFAVNPTTATVDRLEDTDAGLGYSLGAPVFPVCSVDGVEVNPGAPASVTVSGLVPASDVRIIFGDEQVGLDTTDATGGGQFAFTVPPMASEGRHPVTVGNLGTGLTADCTTLVVIATNQPPVAMCQNVSKAANEQCEAVVLPAEVDNGSFDPEDGPLELTLEPTSPYALGMTPVTLTVTDDGGLSDTCDATITVVDETAPTISCPADVTIRCGESTDPANTGVATADDNCMGVAVDFGDQDPGSCPGTIVRTWTATDGSGNTASCTQSIMQVDENQPPVA
ncbi:MAG: hypothetical protein GWO04_32915, partial [Actinobacteria bacterium]|nr:hypothetical protein [Actinomycetota bacterium]